MKTLDEVILTFDGCFLQSRKEWCIENCPYLQNDEQMCRRDVLTDALYYLKEYQKKQKTLEIRMAEYKRGFEQLGVEWSRIKDNPPLNWDELQQMEGKPIWVETDNVKFWTVVDSIKTICNQECLCYSKGCMCRSTHARGDWNAYRKERG